MPGQKRKSAEADCNTTQNDTNNSNKKKTRFMEDEIKDENDLEMSQQNPDFDCNMEADVGIVEKVSITNFMCHKKLEVSLGANVNFIIGRNGSGKSAILTALIVGLGGKAINTSRGNSLKGFIKEGCTYCNVLIKLRNRGSDAYKHQEYGDSIIVERRISLDGASNYKIKSSLDGSVISNKKDELRAILDQYNIQIDNPVSILTQDTARSFLNTSNPRDKYTFFLKATQLEQMSHDYQLIVEEQERIDTVLSKKKEELPELAQQVVLHEEKYKDMQQLEGMKENIKTLKKKLAWAMVNVKRSEMEAKIKEQTKLKEIVPKLEKELQNAVVKEEKATAANAEISEKVESCQEEVHALINDGNRIGIEFKEKKDAVKRIQERRRRLDRDIHKMDKDMQTLQSRILEIKQTVQRDFESERQERENQIRAQKEERESAKAKLNTQQDMKQKLERALNSGKEEKYNFNKELSNARRVVDNLRKRMVELENASSNKLAVYGRNTNAIVTAIENAHKQGKFHRKPVGPLGSYVNLKEPEWAIAVEQCVGCLPSYAVHDGHDLTVLKNIFRNHCRDRQPNIIMSSFAPTRYDVSRFRPKCNYPTVLDKLEIKDDVAFNTIVDQSNAEQVLLIESGKEAQNVIWFHQPQNTRRAITLEGHDVLGGRSSKYYPNTRKKHPNFLQADMSAAIRQTEEELVEAQNVYSGIQQRQRELEADLKRQGDECKRVKSICSQHQDEINRLTAEIQALESFEEEQPPDVDVLLVESNIEFQENNRCYLQNLYVLIQENEVIELDNTKNTLLEQRTALQSELEEKKQLVEEHQRLHGECEEEVQAAKEKIEKLAQEQGAVEGAVKKARIAHQSYLGKQKKLDDDIQKIDKEVETIKADFEGGREKALQYCDGEEVETTRTVSQLDTEIAKAQKRIDREESRRGNAEAVKERYLAVKKQFTDANAKYENCKQLSKKRKHALRWRLKYYTRIRHVRSSQVSKHFHRSLTQRGYTGLMDLNHENESLHIELLGKAMDRRGRRFQNFQTALTKRARMYFEVLLSQRGYTGKMKINHEEETLVIQVNVENLTGLNTKDSKALSGGERSFSTICFIMALWQAMESPFRCLDEFDVFMDMLNRKIAMNMLLEAAKDNAHRQYILLTPQDMSQYRGGNQIRIFKLQDPERGQQTLGFENNED